MVLGLGLGLGFGVRLSSWHMRIVTGVMVMVTMSSGMTTVITPEG